MAVDVFPVEQQHTLLHIIDGSLAFAGHRLHEGAHPVHAHSFVEIAVVTGGAGCQRSLAGLRRLSAGDVLLLRPGGWHGYEGCRALDLYNCVFSTELLAPLQIALRPERDHLPRTVHPQQGGSVMGYTACCRCWRCCGRPATPATRSAQGSASATRRRPAAG